MKIDTFHELIISLSMKKPFIYLFIKHPFFGGHIAFIILTPTYVHIITKSYI